MHKFYWNNTQRLTGAGGASSATSSNGASSPPPSVKIERQSSADFASVNMQHPEVPMRANGATATIRVEQRDQRATTPSGSHRVLLKLKKMSANRPKSMHEDSQSVKDETASNSAASKKKMSSSKSMHGFYNRTWNERSLSKYANQHNYENVYNNVPPNYENIYFGGCSSNEDKSECQGCVISQLTCSPRSRRYEGAQPQPDYHVPPVPPERKGRGRKRGQQINQQPLFRSKSCERPKMRDTFRMEKFAANFNRISTNITDKLLNSSSQAAKTLKNTEDDQDSCREIVNTSGNSILQSVAFRAIPCVDIQTTAVANGGPYYARPQTTVGRNHKDEGEDDLDSISDLSMRPPTASSNASSTTSRPSLALAHKMKGLRRDMQEKISRLRSRSAERISKRLLQRNGHQSGVTSRSTSIGGDEDEEDDEEDDPNVVEKVSRMTKSFSGLPTISPGDNEAYNGPFIGRARALVDYTPSPYDRDALRFSRGDTIDIIAMNPSGLWRGRCQGRIGHFKFINVELLPDRRALRQQRRSTAQESERLNIYQQPPPQSVEDLLKRIGQEEHLSVFVLNGYEELENFHDLDETELDYLGITDPAQRAKILTAVEFMQDNSSTSATAIENDEHDDDTDTEKNTFDDEDDEARPGGRQSQSRKKFERHKFPRDSGCFASSSPASDRSSQPSQSESGIQPDDEDDEVDHDSDEAPTTYKRSPEKSAATRNLRDRHTTAITDLEKLSIVPSKDNFDVLVEKYVTEKTPLQVKPGRVSTTRSIFETSLVD